MKHIRRCLSRFRSTPSRIALVGGVVLVVAMALVSFASGNEREMTGPSPTPTPEAVHGGLALAAYSPESESVLGLSEPDWPALLVDLGGKLLLTIALVYGSLYLLRRYTTRAGGKDQVRNVALVETVSLGQQCALHLVRVGNRFILVGATSSQISMLTEVADPQGIATGSASPEEPSFGERLQTLLR